MGLGWALSITRIAAQVPARVPSPVAPAAAAAAAWGEAARRLRARRASPQRRSLPRARTQHKDNEGWAQLGGVTGVAAALQTSLHDGIDPNAKDGSDLEGRR